LTTVWRIGFCENPALPSSAVLSTLGFGSPLGNGRWHVKGSQQVFYAASSRALCQLEKRVHSNGAHPKNQVLMQLEIPDDSLLMAASDWGLPADWQSNEAATQAFDLAWLESMASLGLWVPSLIEPSEMNLLINPAQPDFGPFTLRLGPDLPIQSHPTLLSGDADVSAIKAVFGHQLPLDARCHGGVMKEVGRRRAGGSGVSGRGGRGV
jgi:RES domain-containing protein